MIICVVHLLITLYYLNLICIDIHLSNILDADMFDFKLLLTYMGWNKLHRMI